MKQFLLIFFTISTYICIAQSGPNAVYENVETTTSLTFNKPDPIKVSVFPNPTTHYLNIEDGQERVGSIKLFSLLGKNVKTFDVNDQKRFDVSDLPNGLYLLQIIDKQNNVAKTIRLKKV